MAAVMTHSRNSQVTSPKDFYRENGINPYHLNTLFLFDVFRDEFVSCDDDLHEIRRRFRS